MYKVGSEVLQMENKTPTKSFYLISTFPVYHLSPKYKRHLLPFQTSLKFQRSPDNESTLE